MTSKIRYLSELTVNQIAAGEVIENPASVVKELAENAIDAGAAHVTVDTLGGGFQRIKVSDDGSGMSPEDAALSLERHATSKILHPDDLFSLATMGFRGEALASIAAISKMTLCSALENGAAVILEVEGGKVVHQGVEARSRGTTLEVRSLFYNVPARKKFQKSAAASTAEITKVVTQLALAHPEVGITLIHQNRTQFSLPSEPSEDLLALLKKRAQLLIGDAFFLHCLPFELCEGGYAGRGLVADPQFSRPNRSGQYLFINRRPVFCLPIAYAIRDAYGTRLSTDRHPAYLLHLRFPPSLIDVNVHPQKKEIRLREENQVKASLHRAVNAAFSSPLEISPPPFSLCETTSAPPFLEPFFFKEVDEPPRLPLCVPHSIIGIYTSYLLLEAKSCPLAPSPKGGILLIDLPAAEERIYFDALLSHADTQPLSQGLLLPATLSFSRHEIALLSSHLADAHRLGFQMRPIGDLTLLIEAIPPFLEEGQIRDVLEGWIGELQGLEKETLRRLAICTVKRARSRKKQYSLEEAKELLRKLTLTSDPRHCPRGKQIIHQIEEDEIEGYFNAKKAR